MSEIPNGKAIKFRSVAERRVSRALKSIRHIGNLSRRGSYDYTPEEVAQMFDAMRAELDATQARFASDKQEQPYFSFE
jgi:hypothetical protein